MKKILTVKQSKELDIKSGIPLLKLMENAGRAIFELIKTTHKKCKVVVLCGPGNNGGDGYVVASLLLSAKWNVEVFLGDIPKANNAKTMYEKWNNLSGKSLNFEYVKRENFVGVDLIIDAMFGSGLNRDLAGEYVRIINLVNSLNIPVISVDLPTGINGDSGEIKGACIQATKTITFVGKKIAHAILPSSKYCGDIIVTDIGIPELLINKMGINIFENSPEFWADYMPKVNIDDNKYTRGVAIINSGEMHGATILASRACRKAGAGMVYIACDDNNYNTIASHTMAEVLKKTNTDEEFKKLILNTPKNAILLGSGNGRTQSLKDRVFIALKNANNVILDADAISVFENDKNGIEELCKNTKSTCVFTPHLAEFCTIFKYDDIDKVGSVIRASEKSGAVVLLKGADTIIASPDGRVIINRHSSPYLSIAGSGDVLSGIITALIAQGMDTFMAACCAVWIHGNTSLKLNTPFLVEDLINSLDLNKLL